MERRSLGGQGLKVSALGLGCMGMSFAYGRADDEESLRTLEQAIAMGVDFWDTAEVYGPFSNEILLGKALRTKRKQVSIATKFAWRFGSDNKMEKLDGGRDNMRRAIEGSLKRLGTDYIDLFYQHRLDPGTPVEETVAAMAELVKEGKVRFIGLSKVDALTIRKAHTIYPLTAVQSEYSLWEREVEKEVLPVLRELGIGFVAYSPLGCGFLTGTIRSSSDFKENDFRKFTPRFQDEHMRINRGLLQSLEKISIAKGVPLSQIALAWLLHQGNDIVPLPGMAKRIHLDENAAAIGVELSREELRSLDTSISENPVSGRRLPGDMLRAVSHR